MSVKRHQPRRGDSIRSFHSRLCALALCGALLAPAVCPNAHATNGGPLITAVDVTLARPISFAATVIGSVLFVVSLPIALTSHSVKDSAHMLVEAPAKDTFQRPLGDLDDFMNYY
jgi:hypothetical protein